MNYLLLNLFFVLASLVGAVIVLRRREWLLVAKLALPMMALTTLFDNAIIGFGFVAYDASKISGLMIGIAPIEDFAYTISVLLLIPTVWKLAGRGTK